MTEEPCGSSDDAGIRFAYATTADVALKHRVYILIIANFAEKFKGYSVKWERGRASWML